MQETVLYYMPVIGLLTSGLDQILKLANQCL